MKQIILLVAMAALVLTSCKDDNGGKRKQWDANAMISLRAAQGVKADNPKYLTPLEIVKQTTIISFWNKVIQPNNDLTRAFGDNQRDLVNQRLLMFGTDIIDQFGKYTPEFIEGEDYLLIHRTDIYGGRDTIAYIPNSAINNARAIIKSAYERGDYDIVYSTFDKAFAFIPITGAEWRALKAEGKN